MLWCIAGSAYPEFFINMETDRLREQMDQNYWSAAYMVHATLRDWLQPRLTSGMPTADDSTSLEPRHIILTSSVVAFYPIVGYSQYAPAKAALRSLSDTLSQELKLYSGTGKHKSSPGPPVDVRIHTIFPGNILSPGYEIESLTKPAITAKLEEDDKAQTEDEVASVCVKRLQNGEYLITTGFLGSLMRGSAWGGSPRNNRFLDTVMSWITSIAWLFIQPGLDGKVTRWGIEHGQPATEKKVT